MYTISYKYIYLLSSCNKFCIKRIIFKKLYLTIKKICIYNKQKRIKKVLIK